MNLSFAGCGFLGIYHVGVAVCFKKYAPHLLLDKISGASAGAMAACCLLCDLPLGTFTSDLLKLAKEARKKALGPFSPSFNVQTILLESMQKYLPNDAHIRVSGKLHVSLTRVYDGKNVIVSQFNSREDLLQALLASSFVPLFSGLLPPRFRGIRYMDGGFSDNLPTLDENTITISPFCGESDICPRDISSQLFHVNLSNTSIELSRQNIYRFARILFPPNPEILSNMCKQGFDDALRFLQRNNLINCTRCLAVQSTFVVSETLDDNVEYDPECKECKIHRQEALVANLPETVMTIFQDAIDSANKGIMNWLFKHKSIKLLSFLSLPYTLPLDVVCATLNKIMINRPKLHSELMEITKYLAEQIFLIISKMNIYNVRIPETIGYQWTIADYDSSIHGKKSVDDSNESDVKQDTDLNLVLQYDDMLWQQNLHKSSCIINMNEFPSIDEPFDNILQVTSDQEALMAYYYMDENKKIQRTEIFDIPEKSVTDATISSKQRPTYDEIPWDEPAWLTKHSLIDVDYFNNEVLTSNAHSCHPHEEEENPETSLDTVSEASIDETTVFSDPESEWTPSLPAIAAATSSTCSTSDSRPEVDQPTQ
ncbi:patatin-like phospholipase domain-containing protein 2 [Fopius arisanus]|uniref:triacylglycerol lipase n=3 Tax=Fopius arisanus TaxID=64838 RepID=A0A9R1U719_9HYME|nr:PREDICTED: patatin-like phospholipase domain-containing protein 2 [Fopius arisanus]